MGSPCTKYSQLNRSAGPPDIARALSEFSQMLGYVRARRPACVVLENIASLLTPRWRATFEAMCATLEAISGYQWHVGLLCPGDHGGGARRPRLFWVGLLE